MPYRRMSCGRKSSTLVLLELQRLYAQRSAVEAAIRELESQQHSIAPNSESMQPAGNLEFPRTRSCKSSVA